MQQQTDEQLAAAIPLDWSQIGETVGRPLIGDFSRVHDYEGRPIWP